jgi:hypothetical protein
VSRLSECRPGKAQVVFKIQVVISSNDHANDRLTEDGFTAMIKWSYHQMIMQMTAEDGFPIILLETL